jgi:hypothetical protein
MSRRGEFTGQFNYLSNPYRRFHPKYTNHGITDLPAVFSLGYERIHRLDTNPFEKEQS